MTSHKGKNGCIHPGFACLRLVQIEVEDLDGVPGKGVGECGSSVRYAADYRNDPGGLGDGVCLLGGFAAESGDRGFAGDVSRSVQLDLDWLRYRRGIDQLEVQAMRLRIVGGGVEEAWIRCVQFGAEYLIAEMGAEHHLRVVAG
jgi:hypothetical protein